MSFSSSKQTPAKVAGFGSAVIDVLMLASAPVALQKKNLIEKQTIQIGGVIPTALVVLSRLGVRTELHTLLGNDTFGGILTDLLEKERVNVDHVVRKPGMITPLACVTIHNDNGQRTSFYTTGEFSSTTDLGIIESLSPETHFLIADGHNPVLTSTMIRKAHAQDTKVLLDMGNPKPRLEELASESDAIIIPKAYWSTLAEKDPEAVVRSFLSMGPELVVLTMEEHGCIVGTKSHLFHQPSYRVTAVDTNGAGDVFFGSFMYGLVSGWELSKCARFACGAAARSCTIFGKHLKIPASEKEVYDFIASHTLIS